jgi:hypothetical protein
MRQINESAAATNALFVASKAFDPAQLDLVAAKLGGDITISGDNVTYTGTSLELAEKELGSLGFVLQSNVSESEEEEEEKEESEEEEEEEMEESGENCDEEEEDKDKEDIQESDSEEEDDKDKESDDEEEEEEEDDKKDVQESLSRRLMNPSNRLRQVK